MHVNQLRALRDRALASGAVPTSSIAAKWDIFGRYDPETGELKGHVCTRPKTIQLWERPMVNAPGNPQPAGLTMNVRCRGCVSCRKHRQVCFRQRAYAEYASAARSRFLTFTFAPAYRARVDRQIGKWIASELAVPTRYRTVDDVAALREVQTALRERTTHLLAGKAKRLAFDFRVTRLGREVTLFLKRLRERSGSKIRYALVAEAHSKKLDGQPHFHMLLHEVDPARLVRKKHIRGSWRAKVGFVQQKLTDGDSRAPSYLAKYLTKTDTSLRRVSKHYGGPRRAIPDLKSGIAPSGVGSPAPVSSRNETTPTNEGPPLTNGASEARGVSLLRKFTLEETWAERSVPGVDGTAHSSGSWYYCDAPDRVHPEGLQLQRAAKAFRERRSWKQLH